MSNDVIPFLTRTRRACLASGAPLVLAFGGACTPTAGAETASAPEAPAEEARHPTSGLLLIPVSVVSGEDRITFTTELADTEEAQARGLMFRTELADDEAMLFPSDGPEQRSFWMKNTPISLDIIFIGTDGRITNIETAVPYSLESVPSAGLTSAVFEIRGGLAEELGIEPGDAVEYTLPATE